MGRWIEENERGDKCVKFVLLKVSIHIKIVALTLHIQNFAVLIPKLPVIWNGFDDSIQHKC